MTLDSRFRGNDSLRGDRLAVIAGLAVAVALSWLYLVPASVDMYGDMDGLSAWMMRATWDGPYLAGIFLMWAAMMVGMMLPSALPALLLFARVVHEGSPPQAPRARTAAFAAGYLCAWTAFSALATLLQWQLARAGLVTPMMESASVPFAAGVLIAAGLYQWTPLKEMCLTQCRSPLEQLTRHWRSGIGGALRMGLRHGLYCVGCCWALMLLLFAGGVMSLAVIGAITIFVLLEKLAPFGAQGGRLSGIGLVGAGIALGVPHIFPM